MTAAPPRLLDALLDYVTEAPQALPEAVTAAAQRFIGDSLAVGVAGAGHGAAAALLQVAQRSGSGDEATAWGHALRLPAASAAMINASQMHALEWDCVHEEAVLHPLTVVLPALLAYAERASRQGAPIDGRRLIAACVVGADVVTLLGLAAGGPMRFFRTALFGGFGAVAGLGHLRGFDRGQLASAFGTQYSQCSGTLQPHVEGSPMLPIQVGLNARAALLSIDLAAAGILGPSGAFDGDFGLAALYELPPFDWQEAADRLGRRFAVCELAQKPYPSGRPTHAILQAITELTADGSIGRDQIVAINCTLSPAVHGLVGRPLLATPSAAYARLCIAFVGGVLLAKGDVGCGDFLGAALTDAAVHQRAAGISVTTDAAIPPRALGEQRFLFTLKDGRQRQINTRLMPGHPERPLTAPQHQDKAARGWAFAGMPAGGATALGRAVAQLPDSDDVASLAQLCGRAAAA